MPPGNPVPPRPHHQGSGGDPSPPGSEVSVGIVGVSSAHPLPLLLYSPSPCQVVEAPPSSDVEMSEVVMWNGNKRMQTQVRLRLREGGRGRGEGGNQHIQTLVRGKTTWSDEEGRTRSGKGGRERRRGPYGGSRMEGLAWRGSQGGARMEGPAWRNGGVREVREVGSGGVERPAWRGLGGGPVTPLLRITLMPLSFTLSPPFTHCSPHHTQVLPVSQDTITIRSLDWDRDRFDIEVSRGTGGGERFAPTHTPPPLLTCSLVWRRERHTTRISCRSPPPAVWSGGGHDIQLASHADPPSPPLHRSSMPCPPPPPLRACSLVWRRARRTTPTSSSATRPRSSTRRTRSSTTCTWPPCRNS